MTEPLTPPIAWEPNQKEESSGGKSKNYPDFDSLFTEMLAYYTPVTVNYEPMTVETLRARLIDWLRPAYDKAIGLRREQTERERARIDADAYARGMGSSTYVTDVKSNSARAESRDISDLEASYGATLAEHLYAAVQKEADRSLEVDQFNAEQWNNAKEKAFDAATKLYATYQASSYGGGGGTTKAKTESGQDGQTTGTLLDGADGLNWKKYSQEQIERMLDRMGDERRRQLFSGIGKENAELRAQIVYSVGKAAYKRLLKQYR